MELDQPQIDTGRDRHPLDTNTPTPTHARHLSFANITASVTRRPFLPQDEAPEKAAAVNGVRIPFAEQDVGALVDRVEVIVGPGIEGEFVEMVRREARLIQ